MPHSLVNINTPANSIIRFTNATLNSFPQENCAIEVSRCLPAFLSSDINFHLQKTLGLGDEIPGDGDYVIKMLTDCDSENVITIVKNSGATTDEFATIAWQLSEDETKAIGFITKPDEFRFSNFMDSLECFVLGIFGTAFKYEYFSFEGTSFGLMNISIVVNGEPVDADLGVLSIQGIADALELLTDDQWIVDGNNIYTLAQSGAVYGTITIDDGRLTTYNPTVTEQPGTLIACSNCFEVVKDICFTSVLKYRCNENSFGFEYELDTTFYNIVRMPLFINSPQPIVEETTFTLSDGTMKQLSARFAKEFEGHVDWFDEATHDRISVALKHDLVYLKRETSNSFTQYVSEGKYDIQWQNAPGVNIDSAPAEFKVKETPFYQVNSNCQ